MAIQNSVAVRNAQADAWETAIGTTAVLKLRTGAQPATCATADSGTVLISYTLASDWAAAASNGAKAFNSVPFSGSASGTGTAAHYRLYASDGTTCHEQGTVTLTAGGGDVTLDNTNIVSGQTVTVNGWTKTWPGA